METEFSKHLIYGNYLSMPNDAFPIDCETLAALQNNIQKIAVIARIAGADNLILAGCQEKGLYRTEGYVYVSNSQTSEVLYHPEQSKNDYCHIAETFETVTADNVEYKNAYCTRYLSEGVGTNPMKWADFVDISKVSNTAINRALTAYKQSNNTALENLQKTLTQSITDKETALNKAIEEKTTSSSVAFVRGMIMMWSGSVNTIPEGWALCDGKDGRPNLIDRFVVGGGNKYPIGGTPGGAESQSVTLKTSNLPSHKHSGTTNYNAYINAQYNTTVQQPLNRNGFPNDSKNTGNGSNDENGRQAFWRGSKDIKVMSGPWLAQHQHTFTTDSVGNGAAFTVKTIPPYYALAFIIKL